MAEEQGADISQLQGTVQTDLIKEYLSRGTYICPPKPSLKMIGDVAEYCYSHVPKWNPMNVCSYHLQEAGATPQEELAFALATAIAVSQPKLWKLALSMTFSPSCSLYFTHSLSISPHSELPTVPTESASAISPTFFGSRIASATFF